MVHRPNRKVQSPVGDTIPTPPSANIRHDALSQRLSRRHPPSPCQLWLPQRYPHGEPPDRGAQAREYLYPVY